MAELVRAWAATVAPVERWSDLGRRIRAARAYADDISRQALAKEIGMSHGWLRGVEGGRGLGDVDALGLITRVSELTGLPPAWFTADWAQLDPAYQPPADLLGALADEVREVRQQTTQLLAVLSAESAPADLEQTLRGAAARHQQRSGSTEPGSPAPQRKGHGR